MSKDKTIPFIVPSQEERNSLVSFLIDHCVISSTKEPLVSTREDPIQWLIDTRIAILHPATAEIIAGLYWALLDQLGSFQLACLELTGVPFMVAIQMYGATRGRYVNGFIIRKERKTTGRQRRIEGSINDLPIVFVDDVMNSGTSVKRAQVFLQTLTLQISHVVALVDFGPTTVKRSLERDGIRIHVLIDLAELGKVVQRITPFRTPPDDVLTLKWRATLRSELTKQLLPLSAPAFDDESIYLCSGSDELYSFRQADGQQQWRVALDRPVERMHCNAPIVSGKTLFIGGKDGNIHALNTHDGTRRWTFFGSERVNGPLCCSESGGVIYVATESRSESRGGSVLALGCEDGHVVWEFITREAVVSSPLYSPQCNCVFAATSDGFLYCLDAACGQEIWVHVGLGEMSTFSLSPSSHSDLLVVSSGRHTIALDLHSGEVKWKTKMAGVVMSAPLAYRGRLYLTALDRRFYMLDANDGTILTTATTSGKVFASPVVWAERVYFASSTGTLYEISALTGRVTGTHHLPETLAAPLGVAIGSDALIVPTRETKVYSFERHGS